MNYCIINGYRIYPSLGNSIKVTKENSLIKDRDAQTMEIEFPLSIFANRKFFGSLNRIDVMKRAVEYKDCILYADNLIIIRGKATITTISNISVKLQIVSGVRLSATDDYYSSIYIDEIDAYQDVNVQEYGMADVGEDGVYALPSVYDETNDVVLNRKSVRVHADGNYDYTALQNRTIQPYLTNVIRRVFLYLGYDLGACFLDEEPWSRVLIYNNRYSTTLRGALPHWSVKTFLDELRKLFNIGYVYDEEKKTVSLHRYFDTLDTVEYECLDEFNTDYDEDGLEYIGASNLVYNLSDSEENKYADMDEDILSKFSVKEYASMGVAQGELGKLSEREKMTTIFHFTNDPFGETWGYCRKSEEDDALRFSLTSFGWFMHLRREASDNNVELNMVPCAVRHVEFDIRLYLVMNEWPVGDPVRAAFTMPSSTNAAEYTESEASKEYVSVEDYLENGNEPAEREEAERMELYFLTGKTYDFDVKEFNLDKTVSFLNCSNEYEGGSFRFEGGRGEKNIGQFHEKKKRIENKEQVVIKFFADDVPDPKNIFVFRNKRFLCDKIEMEINDKGFNKLMTGYFYEMVL